MAAEDSKVALEAGLKKKKMYVKETDVSLLFVPYIMVGMKLQIIDVLNASNDVVLKDVEFNTQNNM
jgi:hypothetical protein